MEKTKDELFLKIIKGELPSFKVYEDEYTFAFLTIQPNTKGHTLVVPKKYSENLYDTDEETLAKVITSVKKVALLLKKSLKADGIKIAQNNERLGGQAVFHLHFHVIPRYKEDGLKEDWHLGSPSKEELLKTLEEISSNQ
jgi:histidine triad (HIT) family protein